MIFNGVFLLFIPSIRSQSFFLGHFGQCFSEQLFDSLSFVCTPLFSNMDICVVCTLEHTQLLTHNYCKEGKEKTYPKQKCSLIIYHSAKIVTIDAHNLNLCRKEEKYRASPSCAYSLTPINVILQQATIPIAVSYTLKTYRYLECYRPIK